MKLTIISGRSGSGKTIALNVLEDLGYYCVDNLPLHLLPALIDTTKQLPETNLAVSLDARNLPSDLHDFKTTLQSYREDGLMIEILYLDAEDNVLLTRFSETRRKHPLSAPDKTLKEAIQEEQRILNTISNMANFTIDTSRLSNHQLCQVIRDRGHTTTEQTLSILIQSFGFKHGVPPDADFVFDVRCLPNPYWVPDLRGQTGRDDAVVNYLKDNPLVTNMQEDISRFLATWIPKYAADNRSYLSIAIGCTGGQHRSVFITEQVTAALKAAEQQVQARHRELDKIK